LRSLTIAPPQTEKAKFENKIEIGSKERRQSDKEN
jgi:hypothetical protein